MKTNKEKILRDLEYINGGVTTLKTLSNTDSKSSAASYQLFDEWQDIICNIMDMIEEDYEDATYS